MDREAVGEWRLLMTLFVVAVSRVLDPWMVPPATFTFARQEQSRPVPVVMIVLDELPTASLMASDGSIDRSLFPNFGRLADRSTWFRNTTTVGSFTSDVMPSILSGRNLVEPVDDPGHRNIFTLLGATYPVRSSVPIDEYCPASMCGSPPRPPMSLGSTFNAFEHSERGFHLTKMLRVVRAEQRDVAKPAFYFSHVVLPHSPWRYLPNGQRYEESQPEPGERDVPGRGRGWSEDAWLTTQVYQRHLLQLGLVDRLIGVTIDVLKEVDIYDECLLVVTADHGIAFEPGFPKRRITPETAGSVAYVPLFIKFPQQARGTLSDRPTVVTDIVPTVSDILHLSSTWEDLDGISALRQPGGRIRSIEGLPLDQKGAELFETVEAKQKLFDPLHRWHDLFAVVPPGGEGLIGRSVNELSSAGLGLSQASVDAQANYLKVDSSAPTFPSLLEGSMGAGGENRLVMISVNGIIIAVTRSYPSGGRERFYAMVSPLGFRAPTNVVEAFAVSGT